MTEHTIKEHTTKDYSSRNHSGRDQPGKDLSDNVQKGADGAAGDRTERDDNKSSDLMNQTMASFMGKATYDADMSTQPIWLNRQFE